MACRYLLGSYPFSSLSLKTPKPPPKYRPPRSSSITSQLSNSDDDKPNKPNFDFLKLSVTLTVISASLPQPSRAAPVKEKKRVPKKSAPKKPEGLTPQELKSWSQGLPVVSSRIPYTRLLELHNSGDLKHIIKPAGAELRGRDEPVLVVLDDSTVKRTVLPSVESDRKFWEQWEKQALDSLCVNAYAPPLKKPELPRPYLSFLARVPAMFAPLIPKRKPRKESKRAAELRLEMEKFREQRKADEERRQREVETLQKTMKARKKEEERRMRLEARKHKQKASLIAAKRSSERMANVWSNLARDQNFTTLLGLVFFYIFYRTVVYNYKKQKKDYDDRLKIEQAEAEERKKMKELERMEGIDVAEYDEQVDPETGENNNYMKMAKQFMKSGARVRRASSKNSKGNPQYMERDVDVKFTDVAGLGKIRYELEEIVKFFTQGEVYRRRGVKIPGGILLCGPPGVGKTLLAKAVAGEAGVNFFSISASQFVEIYVGVGASRVRALYKEAKENAPSVVFIDELDAVGRARGLIKGSGGKERDATLNQLLVSLDGFEGRGEVITIASTNRPDILDPALVRPGRFDRKIYIPKPGRIGRVEILKVHARNKPMAEDVDYIAVASSTDGMVGAELANIVEVAAMNMMRDGRTEITTDDLLQAAQMEERGMLDIKNRSFDTWKKIAINEAALAVVAANFPDLKNIEFVTIAPRAGRELGYVRMKLDPIKFHEGLLTRQSLLDYITYKLAPRAADELWFGEGQLSTIWAETADTARSTARTYVLGGLSEKNYGLSNFWVADRLNDLDVEALQILNTCYGRAKEILERNRKLMDAVVDELVQKKSLTKQEFADLVELHGSLEPLPPSILDIRIAKRKQFHDMMLNQKELVSGSNL